jgi:protein-S-isoprenylcysteine O-methyltransferase Ste14
MMQSVKSLFSQPKLRRFVVALRVPLTILAIVLLAPFLKREWLLTGFVVSMVGELIQLWCFAALDKNSDLAARGPYAMVRNPMYLGRFFIIGGFLLLLGQPWILLPYAIGYWLYMDSRVGREEARLRQIFGESYARYCGEVRRFVPGLPRPGQPVAVWDWRLFRQNNGPLNFALTLAVWAAVAAWLLFRPL